ncbi:MAG: transglycosylase SLT domain-containing protein [Desulfosudaceae bacterium]
MKIQSKPRGRLSIMAMTVLFFMLLPGGATADLVPSPQASASDNSGNEVDEVLRQFEQYQLDIDQDYQKEKNDIETTYQKYQRVIEEEYRDHERRILAVWLEAEISTRKKWVEYSHDLKTKKVVDFENGEIRIEMILPEEDSTPEAEAMFREKLRELIQEDQQTAYSRDELTQRIEERIREMEEYVKTAPVKKTPILARVVTGNPRPSEASISQAAADLQRRGQISTRPSRRDDARVVTFKSSLPSTSLQRKALDYKDDINRFAGQRDLPEELVYAVIHTESAFNPMARSHVPAYGLMQIVPRSAGRDASRIIYGQEKLLSPSYLYNETNNINTGTTYLYLLYNRYLNKISDPTSRLYCTIAAYNTGSGNVARSFTGSTNVSRAATIINRMSPGQVYQHLKTNLPYHETRDYLERVVQRMELYRSL